MSHLTRRGRSIVLLVVAVATGSTHSSLAAAQPPDESLGQTPPAANTSVETPPEVPADAADTIDDARARAAMAQSYRSVLVPALATPGAFTGSVATCDPGTETAASRQASLAALNWFRGAAGLAPVTFDPALDRLAQAAALMTAANGALSHSPPSWWRCTTADGLAGASRSNLHMISGAQAIAGYMADPGTGNEQAGHRRWLLTPAAAAFGHGATTSTDALLVVDVPTTTVAAPAWVSWPPAGYLPNQLEPNGRWSLTVNLSGVDLSGATVTVRRNGTALPVTVHRPTQWFAANTITWDFDPGVSAGGPDASFEVTVANIGSPAGTLTRTYTTTLFDALAPSSTAPSSIDPLVPVRLLDTRPGHPTVDGIAAGIGWRDAGSTTAITVAGRGGVPSSARAVMVNVTAIRPATAGNVVVWPCGATAPTASTVNFLPGSAIANGVLAKVGTNGTICLRVAAGTHLAVDVTGYTPVGTDVSPLVPARLLDTRPGQTTIDRSQQGIGRLVPNVTTTLRVAGRGGVPAGVDAVLLNVTAIQPTANGNVIVWPCGQPAPNASTVNFVPGGAVANSVLSRTGTNGTVCLRAAAATDLVVDVTGYLDAATDVRPIIAARLLETRAGLSTVDGRFRSVGRLAAGATLSLSVVGRGGVPSNAQAVLLNLTAIRASGTGNVIAYPCGAPRPAASSVNLLPGGTIANAVLVQVGAGGQVCLATSTATDLAVDVTAYVT